MHGICIFKPSLWLYSLLYNVSAAMETQDNTIMPDRTPDFVTPAGSCVWFYEMVYWSALGAVARMYRNQEDGSLYIKVSSGRNTRLSQAIQDAFEKFTYLDLEKAILDESDKS